MTSETSEKAAGTTSTTTEAVASRGTATTATANTTPARGATQFQQVVQPVWDGVGASLPMIITVATHAHTMWTTYVDATLLKALFGGVFCFFGGVFPTLFAAVQAAEQSGRAVVVESLYDLAEEAQRIIDESKKEEEADDDQQQGTTKTKEYLQHKTLFVLQKMQPEKVQTAFRNLYTVWLGVLSVLLVQFARTLQTAQSIADFLLPPAEQYVTPFVRDSILPHEYQQWTPVIMNWSCKTIGIVLAWTLTSVQIMFASAMQGGLLLATHGYEVLRTRNMRLGGIITDDRRTRDVQERYIAYGLAAGGFCCQLRWGLQLLPFPLTLLLCPFQMCEWALRYGVMKASGVAAASY